MRAFPIFAAVFAGSVGLGLAGVGAYYLAKGDVSAAVLEFALAALNFALSAINAYNAAQMRGA